MKIEKNSTFQPITVVIESQEEADALAAVLANVSGVDPFGTTYQLYCALDREDRKYRGVGTIRIEES